MTGKSKLTLGVVTLLSAIYNFTLPLHPDEAYYWVWSRNLQLSYYDHPPMVAYLIKLFTLLNQSEFMIRLVNVFSMGLAAYFIYKLAEDMFGEKVAEKSLILFVLMPVVQAGYIVVTPDSPLVLFWTLTTYFFYRYIYHREVKSVYMAGLAGGLLLLSKYTGVLLPAALFLFLVFSRQRLVLKKKELYLAVLLMLVIFLPVIIWNYNHDWMSFRFQFGHGVAENKIFSSDLLGQFIGGQLIVFNPVFFIGLLYLLVRHAKHWIKQEKILFLLWPFAFTFLFFMYQGAFKESEANWAAPAYLSGIIILAYLIENFKLKRFYQTGIVMALLLLVVVRIPEMIPGFPEDAVLKSQFMGYQEIFEQADKYIDQDEIVLSNSYQHASLAQYYLEGRPTVYVITKSRYSNYDLWSKEVKDDILAKRINRVVYIGSSRDRAELEQLFDRVIDRGELKYQGRYVERSFHLYECSN